MRYLSFKTCLGLSGRDRVKQGWPYPPSVSQGIPARGGSQPGYQILQDQGDHFGAMTALKV